MASGFYMIRFHGTEPLWSLFDGESINDCAPPEGKPGLPVVAFLPDRFFFFFLTKSKGTVGDRRMRAAVKLQMEHFFPPADEDQETGILKTVDGAVLGYFTRPDLKDFWLEHKTTLNRANLVSCPFVAAWTAAGLRALPAWMWQENGGPQALYAQGDLLYFRSDTGELQARLQEMEPDEQPKELDLEEVLTALAEYKVKLGRLRLPLNPLGETDETSPQKWIPAFIAVAILGLIFTVGQIGKWWTVKNKNAELQQSLEEQYLTVLGTDLGNDPFGKLLFKLDQLKGTKTQGINVLDLLTLMSKAAVSGFVVDSISLAGDGGTLRGRVGDYNLLQKMLQDLSADDRYEFTLEQATNTKGGVVFSLKIVFL